MADINEEAEWYALMRLAGRASELADGEVLPVHPDEIPGLLSSMTAHGFLAADADELPYGATLWGHQLSLTTGGPGHG